MPSNVLDTDGINQLKLCPRRRKGKKGRKLPKLMHIDDIPGYLKDNEFVITGWRNEMALHKALATFFQWHNESLNIWSHAFGVLLFLGLISRTVALRCHGAWPVLVFQAGTVSMFTCSTLFHLFCCVSSRYYYTLRTVDFIGIIVVMWSMLPPPIWYCFASTWRIVYLGIGSLLSLVTLSMVLTPRFQSNEFHVYRVITFGVNGVWGMCALIHAFIQAAKNKDQQIVDALLLLALQLVLHTIGATFYGAKFPEKYFKLPTFHYLQGHTIFHLFLVAGFVSYNEGVMQLLGSSDGDC